MSVPGPRISHLDLPRETAPAEVRGGGEARRVRDILALIPSEAASAIEVGCGDGMVLHRLRERGVAAVGVDLSPAALACAAPPVVRASAAALPFRDRAVDLVVMADILEHLPDPVYQAALHGAARCARRWILVNAPDREDLEAAATRCACGRTFHPYWHLKSLSRDAVAAALPGFRPVRSIGTGGPSTRSLAGLRRLQRRLGTWPRLREALCPACGAVFSRPPRAMAGLPLQALLAGWDGLRRAGGVSDDEFVLLMERVP